MARVGPAAAPHSSGLTCIGTEHILLGLLREGEGLAAMVLTKRGIGLDDLRRRVLTAIGKVA